MTPRPNAARIGLFALGGIALLVAAVAVLFGTRLFANTERAVLHFRGSVYGLQVGSPVVFRGVRLGGVRSVGVVFEGGGFEVPVVVEIDRDAIRTLSGASAAADPALTLPALVGAGLSGQLATHSLLTGQLYIDLDLRPPGQPAVRHASGLLQIPTTPTRFQSLQDQLDRVDLNRMTDDLSATLTAARNLIGGAEMKQTLSSLAQATASLARLTATLDRRAGPLADSAQGTLAQAGQAAQRVGSAADRIGNSVDQAAERVVRAADRAEQLLSPASPLVLSVQTAAEELARSASALRALALDESAPMQSVQRAMADVARAARAVRELADTIEQQPQSLLQGKPSAP